ncbi:MAG: M3 family metallopeptidase [Bacteroidetes bacterium]|nr:M3 family metallopeptidase [Bacteroidota bacterium]
MKNLFLLLPLLIIFSFACKSSEGDSVMDNPFFAEYNTPFSTPPFDKINEDHYLPAFIKGMEEQNKEIEIIINNPDEPTFENTIEAIEYSGNLLSKVSRVFNAMTESNTSEKLQNISKEISPKLSKHRDEINLNPKLFERVKSVYDKKDNLGLNTEQAKLLDEYYKGFVRGGANLNPVDKDKFKEINSQLSLLTLQFGENVLKENNSFQLVIDNKDDLEGLTEDVIASGAEEAAAKRLKDKWVFTLQKPSMIPFLQYSKKRELREKLYKGYLNKGNNNNELDNKEIIKKIVNLRLQKANLLGFKTYAEYVLDDNMAKNPKNVYELLNKLLDPALNVAKKEAADMQKMIYNEGNKFKLASWDWWHYAEKVKKEKYDLDETQLTPYFKVENVINGVFNLASNLFGITFEERTDIPVYHPDVKTFEVRDADGSHIGILYTDYYPRESKRGGAWMDAFRKQYKKDGKNISPVIYNVGNFTKPTADKPSLLTVDNVNTLFHEFGHAIHGLLSNCTYPKLSGTATPQDFVEFPSQVMENWAMEPVVLKSYAKHYLTGEPISDELIEKIQKSGKFNQGFETTEYLAAALLDMDFHSIEKPFEGDVIEFENEAMKKIGLISEIEPRYKSTYYNHIFSSEPGYATGYYSYIWAAVLDADAFAAFKETGNVLNPELGQKYRKYILSSGGTEDSMELYRKFRGKDPDIKALLEKRGLN